MLWWVLRAKFKAARGPGGVRIMTSKWSDEEKEADEEVLGFEQAREVSEFEQAREVARVAVQVARLAHEKEIDAIRVRIARQVGDQVKADMAREEDFAEMIKAKSQWDRDFAAGRVSVESRRQSDHTFLCRMVHLVGYPTTEHLLELAAEDREVVG